MIRNKIFPKSLRISIVGFILFLLQNCDSGSTCDCFDEPDDAFTFKIDIKSYNLGIPVDEFISASDSFGKYKYYSIKIYTSDSTFMEEKLSSWGKDSILYSTVWSPPKRVKIEIPKMGLKHTFTNFNVEGFKKGRGNCKCFTPTKKTVVLDDSATLDALNQGILFKK